MCNFCLCKFEKGIIEEPGEGLREFPHLVVTDLKPQSKYYAARQAIANKASTTP